MARRRLTVQQAAEELGVSVDAVRSRIRRGSIESEKDAGGRVFVRLGGDQSDDKPQRPVEGSELVEEMRDRIAYLERQVEEEREARRRADTLLARLMDNVPALEAPETVEEASPRSGAGGTQEGAQPRSWWRRWFGG